MSNYPAGYPAYPPQGGKRKGGACANFGFVLLGMVLGVIIFLGIIAGGVYYVINSVKMDKLLEIAKLNDKLDFADNYGATITVDPDTGEISIGDDGKNLGSLTALEYALEVKNSLNTLKEQPLYNLTGLFGIKLPDTILGLKTEEIMYKSISELSFDNFTLGQIFSIIGTEMTIPAFANRQDKTISAALAEINALFEEELSLAKIEYEFGVKLVKDPQEGAADDPITALLRGCSATGNEECKEATPCIKHIPLSEMSQKLNAEIQKMEISDFVKITETSHPVMKALSDLTVEELGAGPEPGTGISPLQSKINALVLEDFIAVNEDSHPIIKNIRSLTVAELAGGDALQNKINSMVLGDIIAAKPGETEHPLFKKLKTNTVGNLNSALTNAIDDLVITDIFTGALTGVLSLFDTCADPDNCSHCDGLGDFCTECSGAGEINCTTCGGANPACPVCGGDGKITCTACSGTHCTVHTEPHGEAGQHFCANSVTVKNMPEVLTHLVNNATLLELKAAGIFNSDVPVFLEKYTIGGAMDKLASMETEDPQLFNLVKDYFEPWRAVWLNEGGIGVSSRKTESDIGKTVTISVEITNTHFTVYEFDKTKTGTFYDPASAPLIETTLISELGTVSFTMPDNQKGIVVVVSVVP